MIVAWLVYSVAIGALLYAGARALEFVAHSLNIATRFIWVAAIASTVVLSTRQLVRLGNGLDVPDRSIERRIAHRVRSAAPVVLVERQFSSATTNRPVRQAMRTIVVNSIYSVARTRGAIHRVDVTPLDRWNTTLLGGWFIGSAALAGILFVAFGRIRELEREFRPGMMYRIPVAISRDVGPALIGFSHPRIVLPRWVLDLPETERRIILAHENEHAAARDPQTLMGALLMLMVQPWNVAVWAMISRLRLAIEMDCDGRVLGMTGDARRYGELLVLVHGKRSLAPQPLLSFVERRSNLERRIRRITSRRPAPRALIGSLAGASLAFGIAAWTPVPTPTHRSEPTPAVRQTRALGVAFSPLRRAATTR